MPKPIIEVENLSKLYRLGEIGTSTIRESAEVWWNRLRGKKVLSPTQAEIQHSFNAVQRGQKPNTFWALKDVSFSVNQGEIVGVIGRNGAGKSTLLKVLSRITDPTKGKAILRGRVASLLEVGTGFHPELTGRENIYLNGSILGMRKKEIDKKFDEIVAFAELEKFLNTPVKHYSSGMYVRLAFAVAAHLEPEILLIDEVLAVGDIVFQKKCLGKMGDVAKNGRTVLFVSHNMPAVQQLCNQIYLFQFGRLIDKGPAEKVISNYLSDALRSEDGVFDLSNHPARRSNCAPIIKRLLLRSQDGSSKVCFYPHEKLIAEMIIEPFVPIHDPRVALAIEDSLGRRILTVASYFQKENIGDIKGPCRIRCTLPRLELGSGRYLISVSIATKIQGLLDSLDNVAWFKIEWKNSYGNGEPFLPIYGPVLVESLWEEL